MKKVLKGIAIVFLAVVAVLMWRDARAAKTVVVVYPTPPVVVIPGPPAWPTPAATAAAPAPVAPDGAPAAPDGAPAAREDKPDWWFTPAVEVTATPYPAWWSEPAVATKDYEKTAYELVSKASLMVRDAVKDVTGKDSNK